jgi:transposase
MSGMRDIDLFQQALGLVAPWRVVDCSFDAGQRRLELRIDFLRGATFACPECAAEGCKVHDTEQKTWRHLDFFQHEAYLTARVPRVRCAEHGVHQVTVAWARPGSGFTLLFEALVMALARQMAIAALARLVGEHDTRIWRIVHHYVDEARARQDLSGARRLGVDETSFRRGQDYVTVFADIDRAAAIFVTAGRDAGTYAQFVEDLQAHGGTPGQITEVCQDLSEAFLSGALEHLAEAEITFDRYHVKAQLTKAVDQVRRAERAEHGELLKRSRYLWLRNPTPPHRPPARPPRRTAAPPPEDRPCVPLDAEVRPRLRAGRRRSRALPQNLVSGRQTLAPRPDHRLRPDGRGVLAGHHPLV